MKPMEREIEARLLDGLKPQGAVAVKLAGSRGLPDRLVLWPGGEAHFVELKRHGGTITVAQNNMLCRLTDMGFTTMVLCGAEEVDYYLRRKSAPPVNKSLKLGRPV